MSPTMNLLSIFSALPLVFAGMWPFTFDSSDPDLKAEETPPVCSVPLQKQYVPISRNGKVVAYKTAYFGSISVGNPAQNFSVVFDTGSGHVLLPASACKDEACLKHRSFKREESQTGVDIEHNGKPIPASVTARDQVSITFGTGKVTGEFVQDSVCLGESRDAAHCARMRMVVANEMASEPFALFEFDGVFGLGFGALLLNEHFSFFNKMVEHHQAMLPQFSVYLARDERTASSIAFGGHDRWRATGPFAWAPVRPNELGYWVVTLTGVLIGGEPLEDCEDGTCRAVFDTGTSLLGVPKLSMRTLHSKLTRDAPEENVDCRLVPGKDITFRVGPSTFDLTVEDYTRPSPLNITDPETNVTKPFCRSILMPVDMAPPLGPKVFILGEPFLRRYYTVYDWGSKRVGFALADHDAVAVKEPVVADSAAALGEVKTSLADLPVGASLPRREKQQSSADLPVGAPLPPTGSVRV